MAEVKAQLGALMDKGRQQEQKQLDLPPIYERLVEHDQQIADVKAQVSGNPCPQLIDAVFEKIEKIFHDNAKEYQKAKD